MSSWNKAAKVNQKTHRERHQPKAREHLGLLEKKKDYIERANDFNKKKKIIKKLKNIALSKNPDEFYHHMIRSKIIDGKHKTLVPTVDEHTAAQAKLLEHRNYNYVSMKRTIETKKIDKIQSQLHMTDIAEHFPRQHLYFNSDEPGPSNTPDDTTQHSTVITNINLGSIEEKKLKAMQNEKVRTYNELVKRIKREKQLKIVQRKMEILSALEKHKGSRPKCIRQSSKTEAPVYLWKYERKR